MFYREYHPSGDLGRYVKCYWVLRSPANPFSAREPLIPAGTVELIWNIGAPYRRYPMGDPGAGELISGSHVVGECARPFAIEQLGAIHHIAIRFRAGGLFPFVPIPGRELTDQAVGASLIFGREASGIEEQLAEATDDGLRVRILESMLRRWLVRAGVRPSTQAAEILTATRLVDMSRGRISVAALSHQLGRDYRHLERRFLSVVGLTPKFYCRVTRFVSVFHSLRANPADSWTVRALDSGYYDQAHFVKEFTAFTGTTPSRFLASPKYIAAMLTASPESEDLSNSYKTMPRTGDILQRGSQSKRGE